MNPAEQKKEEFFAEFNAMKRSAEANEGKLANVAKCVDELTGKFRELRNLDTANQQYRPSGTDAEAYNRYALDADIVKGQCLDVSNRDAEPLRYAALDGTP